MADSEEKNYGHDVQNLIDGILASNHYDKLNETVRSTIDYVFDEIGIDKGAPHRSFYGTGRPDVTRGEYAGDEGSRSSDDMPHRSFYGTGRPGDTRGRYAYDGGDRTSPWSGRKDTRWEDAAARWAEEGARGVKYAADTLSRTVSENLRRRSDTELYTRHPPGEVSSALVCGVFGFLTFCNGLAAVMTLLAVDVEAALVLLVFTAAAGWLTHHFGIRPRARNRRFRTYISTLGGRRYCRITELAGAVGKSEKDTVQDLREMIRLGMFKQAHIDPSGTTFLIDDEIYQLSLQADSAYWARKEEQQKEGKEESQKETQQTQTSGAAEQEKPRSQTSQTPGAAEQKKTEETGTGTGNAELDAAIASGDEYLRKLREANEAIPGEEISRKLDRLEMVMSRIFALLRKKPELLPKLRRFMNYYMPMTDKLVQTYRVLDEQPVAGENIQKAKKEIEDTLDTIIDAYEKLLDSFFAEAAIDVTSDIAVLQNMMAQDGLTSQPFQKKSGEAAAGQEKEHE